MGLFDTIKNAFTQDNSKKARNQKSSGFTTRSDYAKQSKETFDKFKDAFTTKVHQGATPVVPSYVPTKYGSVPTDTKAFYDRQNSKLGARFSDAWTQGGEAQKKALANDEYAYRNLNQYSYAHQLSVDQDTILENAMNDADGSLDRAQGILYSKMESEGRYDLQPYTLDRKTHEDYIKRGEEMLNNTKLFDMLSKYDNDPDSLSYEELDWLDNAIKEYQQYYQNNTSSEAIYDIKSSEYNHTKVINLNAELPPWVAPTRENWKIWAYYTGVARSDFNYQRDAAGKAFNEAVRANNYNYKIAGSEEGSNVVDSLLDAFIADSKHDYDPDKGSELGRYFEYYVKNPVMHGEFDVAIKNRMHSFFDILEVAQRGERALLAGDTVIGGTSELKGQSEFWANVDGYTAPEIQAAQKAFLDNGGYELLAKRHASLVGENKMLYSNDLMKLSSEELEALIDENMSATGLHVPWRDILDSIEKDYFDRTPSEIFLDFKENSIRHFKNTYSSPGDAYNADTGNLLNDIVIETFTDPGLLFGGFAKGIFKGGVESTSKAAVKYGFKEILGDSSKPFADTYFNSFINKKGVSRAVNELERTAGKSIIFGNADDITRRTELFVARVEKAAPEVVNASNREAFKGAVLSELLEKQHSLNAGIVANSPRFLRKVDNKLYKTAYYLDNAIDEIDTILIKAAFPEPFVIRDVYKYGGPLVKNGPLGKLMVNRMLRRSEVVNGIVRKDGTTLRQAAEDLIEAHSLNRINETDYKAGVRAISGEFDNVTGAIQRTIEDVRKGYTDIPTAIDRVKHYISAISGGEANTLDDLEAWIKTLPPAHQNSYLEALDSIRYKYNQFNAFVDMLRSDSAYRFLNELYATNLHTISDLQGFQIETLRKIFNKYADSVDFLYLRSRLNSMFPKKVVDSLIAESKVALNAGLASEAYDVYEAFSKIEKEFGNDVIRRTIFKYEVQDVVDNCHYLSSALNDSDAWYVRGIKNLLDCPDDAMLNFDQVYRAFDQTLQDLNTMRALDRGTGKVFTIDMEAVSIETLAVQDTIRGRDVISVKDVEHSVSTFHLDLLNTLHTLLDNKTVREVLDSWDQVLTPDLMRQINGINFSEVSLEQSSVLYSAIDLFRNLQSLKAFENFDSMLKTIPGMDPAKVYAIESAVLGYREFDTSILTEVNRNPDRVHDYINEVLFHNFGESRLNINTLNEDLRSLLTDNPVGALSDKDSFVAELRDPDKEHMRNWFNNVINSSTADAQAYVDKQMLAVMLMDPAAVARYNKLVEDGETPIFLHFSSTGLNSEADTITGIGYRKWVPVSDPENITLDEVYNIFHKDSIEEFKVKLSKEDILDVDHSVLRRIFNSNDSDKVLRVRFNKLFGAGKGATVSEEDILESFFKHLYEDVQDVSGKTKEVKPYRFVVHDLTSTSGMNGYNMRLLSSKVKRYANNDNMPFFAQYAHGLHYTSNRQTLNTLSDLRARIPDNALTDEEFFRVEALLKKLSREHSSLGCQEYLLNFESLQASMQDLATGLNAVSFNSVDSLNESLVKLIDNYQQFGSKQLNALDPIIKDMKKMEATANSYAVINSTDSTKRIDSVRFTDSHYLNYISSENEQAFNNIAQLFGIDLSFSKLNGARGFMSTFSGNARLGTKHVALNPRIQLDLVSTLVHELQHLWSRTDNYGHVFRGYLRNAIDPKLHTPQQNKAIKALINHVSTRYPNLPVGSEGFMEELASHIFQGYFTNDTVFSKVRAYMINQGFEVTENGRKALDFLDNMRILENNSESLRNWYGQISASSVPIEQSNVYHLVQNCINYLISDDDLISIYVNSLVNSLNDIDGAQKAFARVASTTNPVRTGAVDNIFGNVVNIKQYNDFRQINDYFQLHDYTARLNASNSIAFEKTILDYKMHEIQQMNDMSSYINRILRTDITADALDTLKPYDAQLTDFIKDAINKAKQYSGAVGGTSLSYISYLKNPESYSTVEKFLIARYIYDQHVAYALYQLEFQVNPSGALYQFSTGLINGHSNNLYILLDQHSGLDSIIYKSGHARTQYERRFNYVVRDLQNNLDLARRYRDAWGDIRSHINQKDQASIRLELNGIRTSKEHAIGKAYTGLLNVLENVSGKVESNIFQDTTRKLSESYNTVLQQYRIDRLRVNGQINSDRIINELLWNGHNHIVFQIGYYTDDEVNELRRCIEHARTHGHDYLRLEEDGTTGKVYIFLDRNKCTIHRDTLNGSEKRWVQRIDNGKRMASYNRPELVSMHAITRASDDFDNMTADILAKGWENIEILSEGRAVGTSGRLLSSRELEHYYNTLPAFMQDMVRPQNLLETTGTQFVYDPGFIFEGESDYFLDMLDTMRYQGEVYNQGVATMAYMFGNDSSTNFSHLMRNVSDDDIINFFSKDSDFVVCTLVPSKEYIHGVALRQIRMDSARSIEYARSTDNAVILSYDMYNEVLSQINISKNPDSIRATFNKMLLVMKAFQLCNIGTWVRNWYDATKKAATDMGNEPSEVWTLLMYQGKAMRDMNTYRKILKSYDGFIDSTSWDIIKQAYHTDMTYEDFEILSNMFNSNEVILGDRYFRRNKDQLISGERGGVRGLSETDIRKAYRQTFGTDNQKLDFDRFIDIHLHRGVEATSDELSKYDDMVRSIDTHLRSTRLKYTPENARNLLFMPFSISENIVRYAQAQYLRDFGLAENTISKRIHLTQFGGRRQLEASSYIEHVIPYAHYMYDNVVYWMNMIENNPRYFKYFNDLYGTIASDHVEDLLDKGMDADINRDRMLKTGGIPIGGTGLYFKLNPSFLDFVDAMYGGVPYFVDKLNPLLNIATRYTMSEYGFGTSYFFSELDLNLSPEDVAKEVSSIVPGVNKIYNYYDQYNNAGDYFGEETGMSTRLLFSVFSSLIGVDRHGVDVKKDGFEAYQKQLAKQGLWFDSNKGYPVPLSEKALYDGIGANAEGIGERWEDIEAYMLVHFGKVWDANLDKFVPSWELTEGGLNQEFDLANDPTAWERLEAEYSKKGMAYDYNVGHFVPKAQVSKGDLNDPDITWERKCELMYEKYNKVWDSNRNRFVTKEDYISGGLNNKQLNYRQKAALRLALFGKEWDTTKGEYVVVQDPSVVLLSSLYPKDNADRLYARLGIPTLANLEQEIHINKDGFIVTEDGKYVLTRDEVYNQKVFDHITAPYRYASRGRSFHNWKSYSYNKFNNRSKPKKSISKFNPTIYLGFNRNDQFEYSYEYEFKYNYKYHSPQPGRALHRLASYRINYPYGDGMHKFSYYML